MCGIAGFVGSSWRDRSEEVCHHLHRMGDAIAHRGPDATGYWYDPSVGLGLVHRRLAIVDLTATGAQPMVSANGRYVFILNGEIYNHREIRNRLPGPWRGVSDTEVLLSAIQEWGLKRALEASVGMFAFALWDKSGQNLTLGRDRLGEKPLYFGWLGTGAKRTFAFASELAALRAHPAFEAEIDRSSLVSYLRYNNVGGARSIYASIEKLLPGRLLTVGLDDRVREDAYWRTESVFERGRVEPLHLTDEAAANSLEEILGTAVAQQMVADVPIGAFLSGGVDSSLIVALAQKKSTRPVRTFSIGFDSEQFDESHHARAVAEHIGTDHTELMVTAKEALDVIPELPRIYSEPFADSSQVPTFLLAKLARQNVTVALSGDGGDELFGGYNRYSFTHSAWDRIASIPRPLRCAAANAIEAFSPQTIDSLSNMLGLSNKWLRVGEKAQKVAKVLLANDDFQLYKSFVSQWTKPEDLVVGARADESDANIGWLDRSKLGSVELIMARDIVGYLPDDILTKVDRAAMAVSLETRVPMLDHHVVDFAWRLNLSHKLRNGTTKWLLRKVLYRHVPKALIERPKSGFAIPVGEWLRGPLRDWAESLIDERRLRQEGYFHPLPIRKAWAEHLKGRRDYSQNIWIVLMFQAWLDHQK